MNFTYFGLNIYFKHFVLPIPLIFKLRLAGKMRYRIEGTADAKYKLLKKVIHEAAHETLGEVGIDCIGINVELIGLMRN